MGSQRPQWGAGRAVVATILLVLGILFLLSNFDLLPSGWWRGLWRLWPLLLIVIGAGIVLSRMGGWGAALMVLVLAGVGVGVGLIIAFPIQDPRGGAMRATERWAEPLGELKEAELAIDFGAGILNMAALSLASGDLIDAELTYDRPSFSAGSPAKSLQRSGSRGQLKLKGADGANDWDLRLSPAPAWDIKIDAGAVQCQLDLRQLPLKSLELKVGASDVTVRFPEGAEYTRARIKGGVSNLALEIPAAVAATIRVDSPLSALDIDESRFVRRDGYYASGDPAASSRLELSLDLGVSRVSIR